MLPPQNQNTETFAPLNVGECPHCQTLFAIPAEAQEASLLCPACEAELSQTAMRPRTLQVARLAPVPPVPEVPTIETPTLEIPASPVSLTGSSLLGGVIPQTASLNEPMVSSESATVDALPQTKKSLSETLGWTPSEFTPTTPPVESAEEANVTPYEPLPGNATLPDTKAPTLNDFRFDFGGEPATSETPLEEMPAEAPQPYGEELSNGETLEYGAEDFVNRLASTAESVTDETSTGVEWSPSENIPTNSASKKSWAGPLSAVAGLLVVGLPAGYFALTGFNSDSLLNEDMAGENRALRSELTNDEMPPTPFAMKDKGVVSAAAMLPEKKTEDVTRASFETAPTSLTKNTPEKIDRYANNAPTKSGRYPDDRYALHPSSEPNPFAAANATAMEDSPMIQKTVALEPATPQFTVEEPKNSRLPGAPAYGFETLVQAVAEAAPSGTAFAEGSLANEEEVPAMGQHYARLCYLAQVLTLMDPAASHPDLMTQEFEAVDLFKRLFRDAGAREDSRQIAGPWMTWSGRPHGGVFFAGIPDETRQVGEVYEYRFPVADGEVYVVTEEPIDARRFLNSQANEVGVIGIVVENPETRIQGYEGSAERVIWARKTATLPPTRDAQ